MADVFSKQKRSEVMAAVRSTGNKATEGSIAAMFRRHGVIGWRRRLPLAGKPDFAFRRQRIALFVDGCFWHGCPKHLRTPASNRNYWLGKIARNRARDITVARQLRKEGWRVLRVWEHECSNPQRVIGRVMGLWASPFQQALECR